MKMMITITTPVLLIMTMSMVRYLKLLSMVMLTMTILKIKKTPMTITNTKIIFFKKDYNDCNGILK